MKLEAELTIETALAQADQDAERMNLAMINSILADIKAEEDAADDC